MLKFKDHVWSTGRCVCCTDTKVLKDPTDTQRLRKNFTADLDRRINQLRVAVNAMINKQDILGLKQSSALQVVAPGIAMAGTRQEMFQRWFNQAFTTIVFGNDATWMRAYINRAYLDGTNFGNKQSSGEVAVVKDAGHRTDSLNALAKMELQGIGDASSQQATRVANLGISTHSSAMTIVRGVWAVLEKTMRVRVHAMVNLMIVKAFGDGTLDVYEAKGIATVGLLPEAQAVKVSDNAKAQSKKKVATKDARRQGPGSRVSRKQTPSTRTIQRIRAAELRVAKAVGENVNVRTAGDENVCPICEGIAEDGPYSVNTARSLIPAHPHCRCVFVPADDARFAETDE